VPSRWRNPVSFVVSWAIGGSGGGSPSPRFRPYCTTSILCRVSGAWLASVTTRYTEALSRSRRST
jgi:hypothetical protein